MRIPVLICGLFFGLGISFLKAGNVSFLAGTPEVKGKLSLEVGKIKVKTGAVPEEIDLSDVLEADFADAPFQLNCFYSRQYPGTQLPPDWKAVDLQPSTPPGSYSYDNGAFILKGTGSDFGAKNDDQFFFVGRPWEGNGQWTVHVRPTDTAEIGLMWRRSLDVDSLMIAVGFVPGGGGGWFHGRAEGRPASWKNFIAENASWLRMTRSGSSVEKESSSDGTKWESIDQETIPFPDSTWIGLMVSSHRDGVLGEGVADNLEFTPGDAEPETVPPGVLLRSGTFLAGGFQFFNGKTGNYVRNEQQQFTLTGDQVSAIVAHPITLHQIAKVAGQTGVILKNGDFMESDVQLIQGSYFEMNSLVIGPVEYDTDTSRACVLQPVKALPSAYEIRLHDGSILRAKSFAWDNGQITVEEISSLTLKVSLDEIAQIRAGLSRVQTLIDLPWKSNPPTKNPTATSREKIAPVATDAPATANTNAAPVAATDPPPAAPVANTQPAVDSTPDLAPPPVQCWEGNNQEQIMVVLAGTKVDFPLTGKFRALSMRVAVSPDATPASQATVRIFADGKEIARTPSLKAGDPPQSLTAVLQNSKTVTFVVNSADASTRVLFIDPVAIRK